MNSIRTKEGYAPRRKRWDEALGLSAIYVPDKEIRIQHYATQLLRHIKASGAHPVNVTTWYHHFAFDFVGELAFGQSFGLTDRPGTSTTTKELAEVPKLVSQGVGHTTALTLTMISFELARKPELQKKLREEVLASGAVRPHPDGNMLSEKLDVTTIDKLPFLNGCINESLRLYPAVPTGGIKQTTDKSIMVGDKVIPPQTVIVAPRWSIGRMESSFERADEFIPERWTTQPHLVKDARGLNGFGIGRHQCPGKQLGTTEIRMVLAMVVSNFEWTFSPGEKNPTSVADEYLDSYTARAGALNLVFSPLS
ncbi:putative cytochrome p450 [Rosellinia necatrix]|uniref:Putative cytochrome p450 n=1 Tax=Rosellinia necatrix TaxID=77044 RepID=A0A1W2TXB4_ROSNE|nr:putative cytochrome p450 [Rosellinia necatrix]